jgi:hypothetical protein
MDRIRRAPSLQLACCVRPHQSGAVVVCDLTDPMLDSDEAACLFTVVLEQFRASSARCKLAVFDEAHKYMRGSGGGEGGGGALAEEMVEAFCMMRHEGMRMIISTQNPAVSDSGWDD